jgi:hypothetical protein
VHAKVPLINLIIFRNDLIYIYININKPASISPPAISVKIRAKIGSNIAEIAGTLKFKN